MGCRGICTRMKVSKGDNFFGRYADGQKRCNSCEVYFRTVAIFCACCGMRLRGKPRNTKYKSNYQKEHMAGYLIEQANRGK